MLQLSRAGAGAWDPRWRATWSLGVGQLVSWGVLYYAYAVLAPSIAATLGVTRWTIASAFSLTLLVSGILARPVGRRLDRVGARPVLLAGALVAPLALAALGTVASVHALWLAFAALGLAQALSLYEPAFRAVIAWFPRDGERGRALLLVTSLGALASTVFVPLTASLVLAQGWRVTLFVLAGLLALVAIPTAWALPVPPAPGPGSRAPVRPRGSGADERSGELRLALAFGVHAFASAVVAVTLIWHLVESGAPVLHAAFIAGLVGAAQLPGRLLTGYAHPRVNDGWRVTMNFVAQAAALALVAFGPGGAVIAGALLFGAASGAMTLERAAITAKWFGAERFGTASGRLAAVGLPLRAIAPFAVELAHLRLRYADVLGATAILLAGAAITFSRAANGRRPDTAPSLSLEA